MKRIDLSNLRLLSRGEGLRVYELVDDYVNFVDADVSCGCPRLGGDGMELVKDGQVVIKCTIIVHSHGAALPLPPSR